MLSWQRCLAVIGWNCVVTLVNTTFSFHSKTKQFSFFCWARTEPNHWAHFEGRSYGDHDKLVTRWLIYCSVVNFYWVTVCLFIVGRLFTSQLFTGRLLTGWLLFGQLPASWRLTVWLLSDWPYPGWLSTGLLFNPLTVHWLTFHGLTVNSPSSAWLFTG